MFKCTTPHAAKLASGFIAFVRSSVGLFDLEREGDREVDMRGADLDLDLFPAFALGDLDRRRGVDRAMGRRSCA
eukprot:811185-Rhodomonas_salina.5